MIVTSEVGVTLVGGAPVAADILGRCLDRAPSLVAVDGGAAQVLALGHRALATIGDLDSLEDGVRARLPEASVHSITEQDTTDFAKALRNVAAPFLLATGVTGGRLDHTLAALSTLAAHAGPRCIIVGQEDVTVHVADQITLTLPVGTRVSLYPLGPVTGHSEGLQWPLEGLTLGPLAQLGTSNRSTAPQVRLRFAPPGALVLLPLEALDAVLMGLGISARSPGPGSL